MHNATTCRDDPLAAALERGDEDAVRRGVCRLLDAGDARRIEEAIHRASSMSPTSACLIRDVVDEEAQRTVSGGIEAALFCIPVMLDPVLSPTLAVEELLSTLRLMAAPGEWLVLADGWVHHADIEAADPSRLRTLTRSLGMSAQCGEGVVRLPRDAFPRFPASSTDRQGGIEVFRRSDGVSTHFSVRYVLGAVARRAGTPTAPVGLFECLVDGMIDDEAMEALSVCVDVSAGTGVEMAVPGRPLHVVAVTETAIAGMAMEIRFEMVSAYMGAKPLTHYCLDGDVLWVAMTRDGGEALDVVILDVGLLDPREVVKAIETRSRGTVVHDHPETLPCRARHSVH